MKTPPDCPPQKFSEKLGRAIDKIFINLAAYAIIGVLVAVAVAIIIRVIRWGIGL